jgi:hypothetical protein
MSTTVIKLRAPYDVNGNPRRVFVVMRGQDIVAAYQDDGRSWGSVPKRLREKAIQAPEFETTIHEYNDTLKEFGKVAP